MMTILLDDDNHQHPTFLNITEAFKALSEQSQPGDAVFIHFSGHGGRVLDSNDDVDVESYDEVIVPSDYTTSGLIRDTLMFKTLLAPMRYGVTVTILIDACDTGMVLDLPYAWSTRSDRSGSTAKMSTNDDFSFVRFLKVVKTLYESSTFTQLGRTVGSALNGGNVPKAALSDEDDTYGKSEASKDSQTVPAEDEVTRVTTDIQPHGGNPLLNIFCGSPAAEPMEKRSKKKKGGDQLAFDNRHPSLLEQMINCTLGHEVDDLDDLSELDSFVKSQSFSEDEGSSEESGRDEYEGSSPRRRGDNRGRSRRRRK